MRSWGHKKFMWNYQFKLDLKFIYLTNPIAQNILKNIKFQNFPIIAIKNTPKKYLSKIVDKYKLSLIGDYYIMQISDPYFPFSMYGSIYIKDHKILSNINYTAEGIIFHYIGDITKAKFCYIQALKNNPKDYKAWNNLATIVYNHKGFEYIAGTMFQKSIELNHLYEPALKNMAFLFRNSPSFISSTHMYIYNLAYKKYTDKFYIEAIDLFLSLLPNTDSKIDELKIRKYISLSFIHLNQASEALKYIKKYENDNNLPPDIANLFGGIYFRLNKYIEAENFYKYAIVKNPLKTYFFNLSELLKKQNRQIEAIKYLDYALTIYNNDANILMELASLLIECKHIQDAERILLQLKEVDITKMHSLYLLATIYFQENNNATAIDFSKKFLSYINIQNINLLKSELLELAAHLFNAQAYSIAIDIYSKILNVDPSSTRAHLGISECYLNIGNEDKYKEHRKYWIQFGGDSEKTY